MRIEPSIAADGGPPPLSVFVSYSRRDSGFADELVAGLAYDGRFDVTIDRQAIIEGEPWQERLGALIAECDTVIFLLSPASAASTMCRWEVDEAERLSKRIVPVLVSDLDGAEPPAALAALNYVRFDGERSFMAGLTALVRALNTDVEWLREHTRLFGRAREWAAAGRSAVRLLSGDDIEAAKLWQARRPANAPTITDLHLEYLAASERAEAARQDAERQRLAALAGALGEREAAVQALSRRTALGMMAGAGMLAGGAGLAWWGFDAEARVAREQRARREDLARRGAAKTDLEGEVLAYAAGGGRLAGDGAPGGNSPYTAALLMELDDPTVSLQSALFRVNGAVADQKPFLSTDMNAELFLGNQPPTRKRHAILVSVGAVGKHRVSPASEPARADGWHFPNAVRDAERWEDFLTKRGFSVSRVKDPTRAELLEILQAAKRVFVADRHGRAPSRLPVNDSIIPVGIMPIAPDVPAPNTLIMLGFFGAGIAVDGKQHLVPIDARFADATGTFFDGAGIAAHCVSLDLVRAEMEASAKARVLILDTAFMESWRLNAG